jgi:polar amino acid transport system substrate-binding protein
MRFLPRFRRPPPHLCQNLTGEAPSVDNIHMKGKADPRRRATWLRLSCLAAIPLLSVVLNESAVSQTQESAPILAMPRFRAIDADAPRSTTPAVSTVRLLAETDFAPWSFTLEDGTLAGISVDLAKTACDEAGLTCEVLPTPFTSLVPALMKGQGDVVVSGLRLNPGLVEGTAVTRPYFRALGRFMIREGIAIATADPRGLAGKRLGVVQGSAHEAFVLKHYGKSQIVRHDRDSQMYEALRTGALDVAFGDALRMSFWMNSDGARKCCVALGGGVIDGETFSRPLVYVARKDMGTVRDRLDEALDRLEEKGETAKIFARYLPAPIW